MTLQNRMDGSRMVDPSKYRQSLDGVFRGIGAMGEAFGKIGKVQDARKAIEKDMDFSNTQSQELSNFINVIGEDDLARTAIMNKYGIEGEEGYFEFLNKIQGNIAVKDNETNAEWVARVENDVAMLFDNDLKYDKKAAMTMSMMDNKSAKDTADNYYSDKNNREFISKYGTSGSLVGAYDAWDKMHGSREGFPKSIVESQTYSSNQEIDDILAEIVGIDNGDASLKYLLSVYANKKSEIPNIESIPSVKKRYEDGIVTIKGFFKDIIADGLSKERMVLRKAATRNDTQETVETEASLRQSFNSLTSQLTKSLKKQTTYESLMASSPKMALKYTKEMYELKFSIKQLEADVSSAGDRLTAAGYDKYGKPQADPVIGVTPTGVSSDPQPTAHVATTGSEYERVGIKLGDYEVFKSGDRYYANVGSNTDGSPKYQDVTDVRAIKDKFKL